MRPVPSSYPVTLGYRQKMKSRPTYKHRGIDYGVPVGTAVGATVAGVVVHAGYGGMGRAFGCHVVIKTGNIWHIYAHLSVAHVKRGQLVKAGQRLGSSGATGNVTGPHLHYGEFTSYSYTADRRPQFIDVPEVGWCETSTYVQNCASRKAKWSNRARVLASEMLAADASFIVCTELYAAQRGQLTRLIKHRYSVAGINGGRVIYYRRGRWSKLGTAKLGTVGRAKKRVVACKFAHAATGKRLNVVGAHLTWEHERGHYRSEEATQLVSWAAKKLPENRRTYFGDFNAPALARGRADEVGPVMTKLGYHDATRDVDTPAGYRLDRGFGGESVEFTSVTLDQHHASDTTHPGVAMRLRFPR